MKKDIRSIITKYILKEDLISLASHLIKIPSFTTEETEVARFLGKFMKENGLDVEFQEVDKGRFQVIGRIRGTGGGKTLMFNGHIDIDPLPLYWTQDPWTPVLEGERLYGAGIFNMKAGVTAMTMAAVAIKRTGIKLKGDLMVAAVVGELQGGVGTVHLLDQGIRPDMAVITEPFGAHNIITKHGGVCEMAIHTFGQSRHISQKEEGIDAIKKMMKVMDALDKMEFIHTPDPEFPGLPRMNIGSIIGGRGPEHELRGPYYVSDHCTIFVDIRFCKGMSPDTIKKDIERELLKLVEKDPGMKFRLEFPPDPKYKISWVWMHPLDVSPREPIVQAIRECYLEVTGREPDHIGTPLPTYRGYTGNDTAHFWQRGIPCCIYGPGGDWETFRSIDVEEMTLCSKVLALTALKVCAQEEG